MIFKIDLWEEMKRKMIVLSFKEEQWRDACGAGS